MRPTLPESLLSALSALLAERMGLHFPAERWGDLQRGIAAAAPAFGLNGAEFCARRLLAAPPSEHDLEILASHLTIGETYFFRDRRSFEVLAEQVLPELLRSRENGERRLRIWSAGCCTGEEPYSLAMLLDQVLPRSEDWHPTILATDINPAFLRVAAEGAYGEWSFRDTPPWIRERHFRRRKDGRWEVAPRIRKRVRFSHLNLAADAYPSLATDTNAMDLVLCRNVLMYFTAERAARVVENLHRSLVDGGWLVVGPAEVSHRLFADFDGVEFPGALLYRKPAAGARAEVASAASTWTAPHPSPFQATLRLARNPQPWAEPVAFTGAGPVTDRSSARRLTPASGEREQETPLPAVRGEGVPQGRMRGQAPTPPPGPAQMARACADRGQLAEAVEWCERAIAEDKLDPGRRYLLASIQRERGRDGEAIRSLQRALYLQPDFALAHFALANLRLAQGRRREADRHLDAALERLRGRPREEILPEAEGLTAGRLGEIIEAIRSSLPREGTSAHEGAHA